MNRNVPVGQIAGLDVGVQGIGSVQEIAVARTSIYLH